MQYVTNLFAQAYGACSYGTSSYENSTCDTSSAAAGRSTSGGVLTNTGFDIALIVTAACVIALAAVLVRFWKRPAKPSSAAK